MQLDLKQDLLDVNTIEQVLLLTCANLLRHSFITGMGTSRGVGSAVNPGFKKKIKKMCGTLLCPQGKDDLGASESDPGGRVSVRRLFPGVSGQTRIL